MRHLKLTTGLMAAMLSLPWMAAAEGPVGGTSAGIVGGTTSGNITSGFRGNESVGASGPRGVYDVDRIDPNLTGNTRSSMDGSVNEERMRASSSSDASMKGSVNGWQPSAGAAMRNNTAVDRTNPYRLRTNNAMGVSGSVYHR